MKMHKILLAEDEPMIGQMLTEYLSKRGFIVELVADGKKAYSKFQGFNPDICLFDICLPERDGLKLTADIRKLNTEVPIIFLSGNTSADDVIKGFEAGGNDYMRKPFSMEELIARINNLLKRLILCTQEFDGPIGDLFFNAKRQELSNESHLYKLTYRENDVLKMLVENKNQVMQRKVVLEKLWGEDNQFTARSLDVFISRIRTYFKYNREVDIINIRGVGYKMICNN